MSKLRPAIGRMNSIQGDKLSKPLIVHCCYHKCLTVYFYRVMQKVATAFGMHCQYFNWREKLDPKTDMLLIPHSQIDFGLLSNYVGTHIVRDPRDLLISAYFYHLRTDEEWCARPNPAHTSRPPDVSYQQHLKSLDQEQGLLYELNHVAGKMAELMGQWDYDNRKILELRYEDVIGNERDTFAKVFSWYGFSGDRLQIAIEIGESLALSNVSKQDKNFKHARQGSRVGQWQDFFTPAIKASFKRRFGDLLIRLGYAQDDRW